MGVQAAAPAVRIAVFKKFRRETASVHVDFT